MQEIKIPIHDLLASTGNCDVASNHLDEASYNVGVETYAIPAGIDIDYTLTNVGDAILLTGSARACVHTECARCLTEVIEDLDGDLEGYYLIDPDAVPEDRDAGEFSYVLPDETVDISDAVLAALVVETPVAFLCDEDCKGLCPKCGADLNEGPCGCKEDEYDITNPFYALKDMFSEDDKDEA